MSVARKVRPLGDFLRVLIAPAIWFAHFTFLYVAETFTCIAAVSDRATTIVWTAVIATVAAWISLGLQLRDSLVSGRQGPALADDGVTWLARTSILLTLISALGIFWTAFPVAVLAPCGVS
jgi:hypothetical protein